MTSLTRSAPNPNTRALVTEEGLVDASCGTEADILTGSTGWEAWLLKQWYRAMRRHLIKEGCREELRELDHIVLEEYDRFMGISCDKPITQWREFEMDSAVKLVLFAHDMAVKTHTNEKEALVAKLRHAIDLLPRDVDRDDVIGVMERLIETHYVQPAINMIDISFDETGPQKALPKPVRRRS